ncbi:MAG: hypothetical protein ABIJ96_16490 [Elusimicrobiota bacterium]
MLRAKVNLFDVIDAEAAESDLALEVTDEIGNGTADGRGDCVARAAVMFRRAFGVRTGARLRLTKRIPAGAGLGGGASDAAGTLVALARLHHIRFDRGLLATLKKLALKLGGDVPFFTRTEPVCDIRGSGGRPKPVAVSGTLPWIILVFPSKITVREAVLERWRPDDKGAVLTRLSHLDTLKKKLGKGRPISEWEGLLFNQLEHAVLDIHPGVRQAHSILNRLRLQGVSVSGFGAAVFGFVPSREEGEAVMRRLRGYPWKTFLVSCLG